MMICLSALATWAFVANRAEERAWRWCLYAGLCALGIWAHPLTVFVPAGHGTWLGWRAVRHSEFSRAFRGGLALLLAAITSLTLYVPVIADLLEYRALYTASRGIEPSVFGPEGWHALLQMGGSWYAWAAWPGLMLALWPLVRRRVLKSEVAVEAAGAALVGLPILVAAVVIMDAWMYARFALFILPGAVLLIAAGIESLARWKQIAGIAAGALMVWISALDLAVRPPKQPLRDAVEHVISNRASDDEILVIGLVHRALDFYLGDLPRDYSLQHGADLESKLGTVEPGWIIVYYPNHVSADRYRLLEQAGFVLDRRFRGWVDWGSGDVLVYRGRGEGF